MGYQRPSSSTRITSSWQAHKDRNPPSTQPGTDYGVNYGSPCYAPEDGKVTEIRTNAGPTTDGQGRYVNIDLDDGRSCRALHMSKVTVSVGQRVTRGQRIGDTGASGYGSDWYYGPHVHQTLWPHDEWDDPTIDFEKYVGSDSPSPTPPGGDDDEEEDMALKGAYWPRSSDGKAQYMLWNEVSGFYVEHSGGNGDYNNALSTSWGTGPWPKITESHAMAIKRQLDLTRDGATTLTAAEPAVVKP